MIRINIKLQYTNQGFRNEHKMHILSTCENQLIKYRLKITFVRNYCKALIYSKANEF